MINSYFLNIVQVITTSRTLSDDSSSEQKMSPVPSEASQEKQEKPLPEDIEQNNVTGTNQSCSQDNLTDHPTEEKVEAKQEEISSKVEKATATQLKEIKGMDKSDEKAEQTKTTKQSSLNFLKWTNKQPTHAKGKRRKEKKNEDKTTRQTEVSDYFVVRRSGRKCKSVVQNEKQKVLEEALLSGKEEGLEVKQVEGKGRGVFSTQNFTRGQFVCEYAGELIDYRTAKEREKFYEGKTEFGCYMYYFTFKNKKLCVDATKETGRLGRLLNHSKTAANCATRLVCVQDKPYLILETIQDVSAGEELLYDYGERSKDVVQFHQWLKS